MGAKRVNSSIWKKIEIEEKKVSKEMREVKELKPSPTLFRCDPKLLEELGEIMDTRSANDWARLNVPGKEEK